MELIILNGIKIEQFIELISELIDKKLHSFSKSKSEIHSQYLSRAEVAGLFKISLPTLHEWTKLGWFKSYKIGNRVLYKLEEVLEALEKTSLKHKKYSKMHNSI